jgi:alpha-mannosidase
MHPRSILNWISSSNGQFGVTISSSVVAWDYVDNFNQTDHPVLQAILFVSRQSCHGEGNDYLQTGNHEFSFSFTSHKPGWENGYKSGVDANHPFFVVVDPYQMVDAELPEELSFFSLDKENVMITAVKRSEDGNGLILRWYETEGKDTEMNLNSYFEIREAKAVNLIEEEEKEIFSNTRFLPFKTSKYSIETIKLILK